MKTEQNFTTVCNWDINSLKDLCNSASNDTWDQWKHRQETYGTHVSVQSIPFSWSIDNGEYSAIWTTEQKADLQACINANKGTPLANAVFAAVAELSKNRNGVITKLCLAKLLSGEIISPHTDNGPALQLPHRCHLPIISPPTCIFTVGGESKNLVEGTWVEINNTITHGVVNSSDNFRVHIMCDIMPQADYNANLIEVVK